jgi:5,5'-dehydrodivanillate O-demethylase oxygenase subunit
MVSVEDNELMTRVGPGTPAGELLRRYWHPICPTAELSERSPKKRIRVLGEDLVLFRDGQGRHGLVSEQCAHRSVSLYYGFIEADGLRCPYHGWKYDVSGRCIEQPFEPEASPLENKACQSGYKVQALGGLFWAYMGPDPAPLLPRWAPLVSTAGVRRICVLPQLQCNWLQIMENSVDTTHTYYLHGHMMHTQGMGDRAAYYYRPIEEYDFEVVKEDTWTGVRKIRTYGGDRAEKELGHPVIFPCILLSPQRAYLVMHCRVPVDDTHTQVFRYEFKPGVSGDGSDLENPPVEYVKPFKDEDGNFHLKTFGSQDAMAWETQGPVADRSREHLGVSDRGIALYRRMLREQIALVQSGKEPAGLIRDPAKNREIAIAVSQGQARMAREMKQAG